MLIAFPDTFATRRLSVAIVAGEVSGDQHGAKLVSAMKKRCDGLVFFGIGGSALKAAGVRLVADAAELSVVGLTEVVAKLPAIVRALRTMRALLVRSRPDLLILIDFPDFNLRLAATAKRLNIPVLYYISPQVWAWRTGRVRQIRRRVDRMAVILPFEEEFYRAHGVPVTYVGHPLLDDPPQGVAAVRPDGEPSELVIGLLPGSRGSEVVRHLPVLLETARLLKRRHAQARFMISRAPAVAAHLFDGLEAATGLAAGDVSVLAGVDAVLSRSRLVVAASGTVTLQAALYAVPMVIIYKVSRLSYWLGRFLVRVRHVGLVNLVAGKPLAPELINADASPENISRIASDMLADPVAYEALRRELSAVREKLGAAGASERAAGLALEMLTDG